MNTLDYIVIVLFTTLIVAAGLAFRRRGTDMTSYFAAGGALPWSMSGLSLFMSFFSAGTFVVWGSIAYELGWVAVAIQMTMCLGGFIVAIFIAPAWKKQQVLTAAEFIRLRLGSKVQQAYTYFFLLLSVAYTGAFLYPVARIVNVSTGFSITACVILLGLIIILYTVAGGLWAVVVTDILQFVILTVVVVIVVVLAVRQVGGVDAFVAGAPEDFFAWSSGEYTWPFLFAFIVYHIIFIGGNWAYVQRFTSVKSPRDAKKVGLTFGWLYLVCPIIWMVPPMIYKVLNPELAGLENEGAYILICKALLPAGMLGMMLAAMVFATASSVNTTLNLAASVITNDLFKLFKPGASQQLTMRVARLSTFVFGLITIVVALLVPAGGGIVNVVLSVGAVTGGSLYAPPIWAMFSKRLTGSAVLWISGISFAVNIGCLFLAELSRAQEMMLGVVLPLALLAAYELYARRAQGTQSSEFRRYAIAPRAYAAAEEAEAEQNVFGQRVLATCLAVIGVMVIVIGILTERDQVLIVAAGGLIMWVSAYAHPSVKLSRS